MQDCLSDTGYHNRDCTNSDNLAVLLIRRLIWEISAKYEIPLYIIQIMKELGHCPRCKSPEIRVGRPGIGVRNEVCQNCGFMDVYMTSLLNKHYTYWIQILVISLIGPTAFFVWFMLR